MSSSFYDITATHERRQIFIDVVRSVAETINIPFTIGGGISTVDDFEMVLQAGADKVSVNSAAVLRPDLIREALNGSATSASSCPSMPSAMALAAGRSTSKGGRKNTGIDAIAWASRALPSEPAKSASTLSMRTARRTALTWI